MSVTITKFQPHSSGKLVGFLDIAVPMWGTNLNIKGCKVFDGPHGHFVSLPSREYEQNGEKKYSSIIGIDDEEIFKKFVGAIKAAWLEYRQALSTQPNAPEPVMGTLLEGVPF